MNASADGGPIEVPEDADVIVLHKILACANAEWAQSYPHEAMQIHVECAVGECVAKSIAWGVLVNAGVIVPESSPSVAGPS